MSKIIFIKFYSALFKEYICVSYKQKWWHSEVAGIICSHHMWLVRDSSAVRKSRQTAEESRTNMWHDVQTHWFFRGLHINRKQIHMHGTSPCHGLWLSRVSLHDVLYTDALVNNSVCIKTYLSNAQPQVQDKIQVKF